MGFFGLADAAPPKQRSETQGVNIEALREQGCALCPLNDIKCHTPKMRPQGSKSASVYILGDAPSKRSDKEGVPIGGDVGGFIRGRIPSAWRDQVRWGNVVQDPTGPGEQVESRNRDDPRLLTHSKAPNQIAIECCRSRVESDILKVRPDVIITIGKVPLYWIAKETHAYLWEGRCFPAQLGDHKFWVYPFRHPYDVMKDRRWDGFVSDDEASWTRHFKNLFRKLDDGAIEAPAIHTEKTARKNVEWVMGDDGRSDLRKIEKHIEKCVDHGEVGMDYETSALRPYGENSKILTAGLDIPKSCLVFPFDHKEAQWTPKERKMLDEMWYEFLTAADVEKIAHQLAFEMEWSAVKYGPEVCRDTGKWHDTISQAYIINPRQGMLGLENLTQQYWGLNLKGLSDVNRKRMADEPLIKILPYNGMDSKYHRKLHEKQIPILRDYDQIEQYEHQLARIPTLVLTQIQGVPVDQDLLKELRGPWEKEQYNAWEDIQGLKCFEKYRKTHGVDFNPASQHDAKKMLKLIKQPRASTDEKTLREIDHPFADALLRWRKPTKVLSTYCDPITVGTETSVVHDDGMLHPVISGYKVETWRTSSEEPNQQNWPKRGKNVIIRRVVRKDNYKVVAFDYAGIQARNIAMESRDPAFAQAFFDWYDIHSEWVREFATTFPKWAPKDWEKDKDVFKKCRDTAKTYFVFPSFFGAKPKSITPNMNAIGRKDLAVEDVEEMQDRLFARFPKIKQWQLGLEKFYKRNGYVTGLSGFRRYAPVSWNQLINSPIQSDESVIVLSAMNALSELNYKRYQASMEIHDDLTFLWPEHLVEKRSEVVIREMLKIRFDWINVPLVVERSIGDNWCDLNKAGNFESVGTDDWREVKDK
jgi:DNA polymerase I-like protein with 3'-5' exonuclease and polymerase domains/uracil-DNA glycosylase